MNAIWWDEDSGQVCISSLSQTFPPRTLLAKGTDGLVTVHRRMNGVTLIAATPDQICRQSGEPFDDVETCVAYLNSVFDRTLDTMGFETVVADEVLGGHRVVRISGPGRVAYASCDRPSDAEFVVGLTRSAADAGTLVEMTTLGAVEEPSWSWPLGPLFLGLNGQLSPTPPTAGFVLRVATVITPTRILLVHDEPYLLAS